MKIKDFLELLLFQKIRILIFILPRPFCLFWGRIVGLIFYWLDRKHRLITQSNLKIVFGSRLSSASIKKISKKCFIHFGQTMIDVMKFPHLSQEKKNKILVVEGEENLKKALLIGKGALLFSGHYGNWEIASFFLSKIGNLNVIARPLDNKFLEKELLKLRTSLGARVIYKKQAAKYILQSLRAREMVALLIDQNVLRHQAVFVDFFGKKAATTPSLAAFYLRTKSPLLPVFCYPLRSHKYHLKIYKPLEISLTGDYSQDVLKITQICTKIIENQIKNSPDYWFWFHKRWKTRPEGEI